MSNPWASVMPGGVVFPATPSPENPPQLDPPSDADELTEPVGAGPERDVPETPGEPAPDQPEPGQAEQGQVESVASTDVDTPTRGEPVWPLWPVSPLGSQPVTPPAPVTPAAVTPEAVVPQLPTVPQRPVLPVPGTGAAVESTDVESTDVEAPEAEVAEPEAEVGEWVPIIGVEGLEDVLVDLSTGEVAHDPDQGETPTADMAAVAIPAVVIPAVGDDAVLDGGDSTLDDPVLGGPVLDDPVLGGPVLDDPVLDGPVLDDPELIAGLTGLVIDTATPKAGVLDVGSDWTPEELLSDEEPEEDPETVADRRRSQAAARKVKAARSGGLMLTERDMAILGFLSRYRYATYPQLARAFHTTPVALRQRMPRLAQEGLVVRRPIGKSQHGVWLPTSDGVKLSGLDLPTPTLSWATAAHTLGLVDIGVMYELAGEEVVTEREIRAADQRDRPTPRMRAAMRAQGAPTTAPVVEDGEPNLYVVELAGGGMYGHIPDMVLARPPAPDGSGAAVAVELELRHKPATQWRKILAGYAAADHIGEVVYYTNLRKIARGIARAATEIGAAHMVTVRRFEPSESSVLMNLTD